MADIHKLPRRGPTPLAEWGTMIVWERAQTHVATTVGSEQIRIRRGASRWTLDVDSGGWLAEVLPAARSWSMGLRPGSVPGLPEDPMCGQIDRYGERDLTDAGWVAAALDFYLDEGVDRDNDEQIERIRRLHDYFDRLDEIASRR